MRAAWVVAHQFPVTIKWVLFAAVVGSQIVEVRTPVAVSSSAAAAPKMMPRRLTTGHRMWSGGCGGPTEARGGGGGSAAERGGERRGEQKQRHGGAEVVDRRQRYPATGEKDGDPESTQPPRAGAPFI